MSSIRARLLAISAICLSIVAVSGTLAFASFEQFSRLNSDLAQSYDLVDAMIAFKYKSLSGATSQIADNWIQMWRKRANKLQPKFRGDAVNAVLKDPSTKNLRFLSQSENEYRRYLHPLINYFSQRAEFFGALALASTLFFSFGLLFYVLLYLFSPLRDLSKRMDEFVHNRYSYEFAVPEPNEIGELQNAFDRMAQQVLNQIEELKSLDKAKSDFLNIASHELRTPLTSIKGSLALLNSGIMGKITASAQNLMTIALDETDRLIRLINELLDLAKIEARQFPLHPSWISSHDLISNTFQGLSGFCQTAQVQLENIDTDGYELFVDSDRIQQVLTNLLSNAVKYSPKNQTVTVRFVHDREGQCTEAVGPAEALSPAETDMNDGSEQILIVEVHDKGRGIAPEDQALIFEKFRQASSPQNPLVKGTGLGLAIAKTLVEQHGGTIGVRSRPGDGSTFYFTIPKWRRAVKTQLRAV